jgi:hypothetical protein
VSRLNVRLVVIRQTYAPKPGRTVTVWQGNPILTECPIAPAFLDYGCYGGIRTNRRFSTDSKNSNFLEFSETRVDIGEF